MTAGQYVLIAPLLTDVVTNGVSGRQLAEAALRERAERRARGALLTKAFGVDQLAQKLRRVLAG